MGKLIVISAPSGAGKTSIVHFLLQKMNGLSFSVSACSREKRENEKDGTDYHFLGIKGFKSKISEDAFLEWEEVYDNQYYGTLKSEVERIRTSPSRESTPSSGGRSTSTSGGRGTSTSSGGRGGY